MFKFLKTLRNNKITIIQMKARDRSADLRYKYSRSRGASDEIKLQLQRIIINCIAYVQLL